MNVTGAIDLHTHTNQSDGMLSPEALVDLAKSKNLAGIAITDHDEVSAIARAMARGAEVGIEIIPGVELSILHRGYDVHILGYFIDDHHPGLLSFLGYLRHERVGRTHRILEKLETLGMPLSFECVMQYAGEGCIGRPHVAEALVQEGYVRCYQDAFDFFLAEGKPAFEPKAKLTPREAIDLIHDAGGLACLAHPGQNLTQEVVLDIVDAGVEALETVHPKHSFEQRRWFRELATKRGLLQTAGSDFHGGRRAEEKFGQFTVTVEQVRLLQAMVKTWH